MKHPTKLTLTSTTPEHIGLKNRPRGFAYLKLAGNYRLFFMSRDDFWTELLKIKQNQMKIFCLFVCLNCGLTSQSTTFQSCRDGATAGF